MERGVETNQVNREAEGAKARQSSELATSEEWKPQTTALSHGV